MRLVWKLLLPIFLLTLTGWTCINVSPNQCYLSLSEAYVRVISLVLEAKKDRFALENLNANTSICDRQDLIKPHLEKEPQEWMMVKDRKVMVFSAFFESRSNADGPSIRVVASGWQEQFQEIGDLYCHLWYKDMDYAVVTGPALYKRIYPSTSHADMWVSHFIICKLPRLSRGRLKIPYAVSIVPKPCITPGNALMVLNRKSVKKGGHALCVSPLYGRFKNWTMITEMFEFQKLLGAEEITIYRFSVDRSTEKLLESYLHDPREKVNVVDWQTFPEVKANVWCQRGALNDCLYRMGHKYKYVTITDLDEILVPRVTRTCPQLLKRIAKPEYGAYLFQHFYFRRNVTEAAKANPPLITQTSFWRTDVVTPPGKIRCKSMYEAEKAVKIDLHFPYLLVPGAKEYLVNEEEAVLHHYRAYPMESFRKHPENYHYIEDRYLETFKEPLLKNYLYRVEDVQQRL